MNPSSVQIISGRSDIKAALFTHSWTQSSIIAKIAGKDTTAPVTIVGAHMDSINLSNPTNGAAPGADDDGTGSVNLLEALRALVASGWKPATPVEFHWYSGEEAGLLQDAVFGGSAERLAAVRERYDPMGLFAAAARQP